jgi:hypothetical protein
MKNTKIHLGSYWPIYAIGAANILILAVAYRYLTPSDKSFEWPAWMQAVGSISAILVAIWVSSHQARQQRTYDLARQQDELDGVLRSIRGEVFTTQLYFASEVVPAFRDTESGQQIRTIFSLPEYPFPIFDGLIPKLGMISDKKLLQDIIRTYAQTKSLALTAKVHNKLVEEVENAERDSRRADSSNAMRIRDIAIANLARYGAQLRDSFDTAFYELQELSAALAIACPDD